MYVTIYQLITIILIFILFFGDLTVLNRKLQKNIKKIFLKKNTILKVFDKSKKKNKKKGS